MTPKKRYKLLKNAKTKPDLASILGISPQFLTRVVYVNETKDLYNKFEIKKKSGGVRVICAPVDELKEIQRKLSDLLLDCKEAIYSIYNVKEKCTLSHGFERNKSIVTNSIPHKSKKNVLNLDLEDFFDSFNFGRVRGFFISNNRFELEPDIATVIAKIACYENKLPQGSPCSPVVANLITNSLDIKLSKLARKNGCAYTRYADDITFSTRKNEFPKSIIYSENPLVLGRSLVKEIERSGLSVNDKKSRLQFKNSRQEATGLVINKKINVKSEYWRNVRAMAYSQFKTGEYKVTDGEKLRIGTMSELEGKLAFIDSVDRFNNVWKKSHPVSVFEYKKYHGLFNFRERLNSREKTYSRFLYYKYFFNNEHTTILTEGKTDNVYLKSALNSLRKNFPSLVSINILKKEYKPNLLFPNLNKKTMYFLDLEGGASHYLRFVQRYINEIKYYENQKPKNPVIMVLDNDTGPKDLINHLASKVKSCPNSVEGIKESEFIHIFYNLYILLTPLKDNGDDSMMEDLFDDKTLAEKVDGKTFSTEKHIDINKEYGKQIFSTKVVRANQGKINFDGFKVIFERIVKVNEHYSELLKKV